MKNLKFWVLLLSGVIASSVGITWAFCWHGIDNFPGFWGSVILVNLGFYAIGFACLELF